MSDFEFMKRLAQENHQRRRELESMMGKSVVEALSAASAAGELQRNLAAQAIQPLLNSFRKNAAEAALAQKSIADSIRATQATTFQNIFNGIDAEARESVARTVAGMHHAMGELRRGAFEAMSALSAPAIHREALASIAALTRALPKDTFGHAARAIAEAHRINFSKLGAISGSGAIAALDYSSFSPGIEQIRAIQSSFSGQLAVALREMLTTGPITEDTARPVLELIDSRIDSRQKGRITAEGLLGLLLALIAVIIASKDYRLNVDQASSSDKAAVVQEQQLTKISELLSQVVERIDRVAPVEDSSTYYVVEREVILRLKPNTKSSKVALLFPNQRVRLVKPNHQWIYVEYFDEFEGVPKYGWAYKKYLKKLD